MENSKALAKAKKILNDKGVISAGLDATILLAHALLVSKDWVIFNPDFQLSDQQQKNFFELITRRANREPVSHLIGRREFFGEDFLVNKNVLDPRPDSEILIEAVLASFEKGGGSNASAFETEDFGQTSSKSVQRIRILELGVGSGCLIITLLRTFKNAVGTAVDISELAIETATENSKKHQVAERLKIVKSDLFLALNPTEKFDLIISNPPYIPSAEIEKLEAEVKIFEPRTALDGGADGLDFYRRIAAEAKNFLTESGKIFLEIGYDQSEKVAKIFSENNFRLTASTLDLSGVIRVLQFEN